VKRTEELEEQIKDTLSGISITELKPDAYSRLFCKLADMQVTLCLLANSYDVNLAEAVEKRFPITKAEAVIAVTINSLRKLRISREEESNISFDQNLFDRAEAVIKLFCKHASPFTDFYVSVGLGMNDEVTVIFNGYHHIRTLTVDLSSSSSLYHVFKVEAPLCTEHTVESLDELAPFIEWLKEYLFTNKKDESLNPEVKE